MRDVVKTAEKRIPRGANPRRDAFLFGKRIRVWRIENSKTPHARKTRTFSRYQAPGNFQEALRSPRKAQEARRLTNSEYSRGPRMAVFSIVFVPILSLSVDFRYKWFFAVSQG